jgi:hypothetical protein
MFTLQTSFKPLLLKGGGDCEQQGEERSRIRPQETQTQPLPFYTRIIFLYFSPCKSTSTYTDAQVTIIQSEYAKSAD